MAYGVIYLIWNMINGMKYAGQTTRTVEQRFKEHKRANSHLGKSIRCYGAENFRYGIIKSCTTAEELNYWEKYFVAVPFCGFTETFFSARNTGKNVCNSKRNF